MSKFEVIRGVEGCCLALDDTRIAGPKPWGGGTVIHAWETDERYGQYPEQGERENGGERESYGSRWHQLFSTPERAANTLKNGTPLCDWCDKQTCAETRGGECSLFYYDALLEWLNQEVDE